MADSTKEILGVPTKRKWAECNMLVHTFLLGDWMTNLAPKVTDLLEAKHDILVYSGDKDFICNWRGGEAWSTKCDWSGKEQFDAFDYVDWKVDGKAAGALKSFNNLHFLRVYDAGHMV